jgi:hypothetical protein
MSIGRVRAGELLALLGASSVLVSLFVPSYQGPAGQLDAWDSFGPAVALLIAAACAALALVASALAEQSTALPVSTAVWSVLLGLIALIAAIVRLLERPDHSNSLCAGPWLALAGAAAILLGAWLALRDERTSMYEPASPPARERPGA